MTYHLDPASELPDDQSARLLVADESGSGWNPGDVKFHTIAIHEIARADNGKVEAFISFKKLRSTSGGDGALVVAPGMYVVKLACQGGGFGGGLIPLVPLRPVSQPVRVEAGYDYTFVCTGRVPARLRAEVEVRPRNAAAIAAAHAAAVPSALVEQNRETQLSVEPWRPDPASQSGIPDKVIPVPAALSDARLMLLVRDALQGHGWTVSKEHATWVRGTFLYEDVRIVVDIVRDGSALKAVYVESANFGYKLRNGKAVVAGNYAVWVDHVLGDIAAVLRTGGVWAGEPEAPFDADWNLPVKTEYVDIPMRILTLPGEINDARAMKAVEDVLRNRGWRVMESHRRWARAALRVRGHLLVVDVLYSPGALKIAYRDSNNLDFKVRDGRAAIHKQYFGWTNYLMQDVARMLGALPPSG